MLWSQHFEHQIVAIVTESMVHVVVEALDKDQEGIMSTLRSPDPTGVGFSFGSGYAEAPNPVQ